MAGLSIADFFASVSYQSDETSRARAEGSYAKFERAVRDSEAKIEAAKRTGAKAAVRYALEIEAAQAREALEAAKAAAKVVAAEEAKTKAVEASAKVTTHHSESFVKGMTAITLAAGTMGLAVGAALGKVVGAFDSLYFASQRTGASVKNIQGLQYAFSQVGSTGSAATSAIESFARQMRTNLTGGFIRSLGVATSEGGKARDTFDILSDTIDKISEKHPYHTGAQMAEVLGLSEEQFETFNKHRAQIKQFKAEYESTLATVGLNSEQAAKQSEHFEQSLRRLGMQVSVAGQALLVQLIPVFDKVVASVGAFLTNNAPALNSFFARVGELASTASSGVNDFIGGFTGEEGAKRIQAWADAMNSLADGMRGVWRVMSWIQDSAFWKALTYFESPLWKFLKYAGHSAVGSAQAAVPGGGGFNPVEGGGAPQVRDRRNVWQRYAPKALGGRDAPREMPGGSTAGNLTRLTDDEAKRAGIDPRIMHGIRAGESGKRADYDKAITDKEESYGPWQLNRKGGLGTEFERETGLDLKDPKTIPAQTRWVAEYIARRQKLNPNWNPGSLWHGYKGNRDADPSWGDAGYSPSPNTAVAGMTDISGRAKYSNGQLSGVKGFVMHHTGGRGTPEGVVDTLNQRGLGVQYVMDRDGKIFQTLPSGARGAHIRPAQNGSGLDNSNTLGMEVIAKDDRDINPAQIEAAKAFLSGLSREYPGLKVFGHGEINGHKQETEGRTIVDAFRSMSPADRAVGTANPITLPQFAAGFNPANYDTSKIAGQPMGASAITTNTNNAGATVTMQPTTHVTIQGGDPASNAAQFERAAGRVNDQALRNVQTAIR